MNAKQRRRLERAGWRFGSVQEFLGLTDEETAFIELKLTLARQVRERRVAKKMTQTQLSKLLRSSQSRVAKMEAADSSVSIDLLVRSLFAMGVSRRELARAIAPPGKRAA